MGKLKQLKKLLFAFIAVSISATAFSQTAKVQVIHNSADPAAANVAVWIVDGMNASKAIDSFEFREATGYVDLPAGSPIKIAFSAAGATSINDTIAGLTTETTLIPDSSYIVMAVGNIGTNFLPNPDNRDTKFRLLVISNARQTANNSNNVEFVVVHAATDVPAVDVYVRGSMNPLVDNAAYGDATPYYSVPNQRYLLDLTLSNSTSPLATYDLDASNLMGGTAVIFASGYFETAANSNGENVGLYIAFANGNVVELTPPTAEVQVIHNSADPAAANVAVWIIGGINGTSASKAIDNFEFRDATSYVGLPAGSPIKIAFSAAGATSVNDTIAGLTTEATLMPDSSYVVMAVGNVGNGFLPNPNGRDTKFRLLVVPSARQAANNSNNLEFVVVHAATDVPAVDVYVKGSMNPLVDGATYGDATPYYSVPAQRYLLDITLDNSTTPLLTLDLDANGAAGASAVVFASGYLQPAQNSNGEFVGFFVATADGTVEQLLPPTSRLQVIHNSADPAAASVDVYATVGIITEKIVDDFDFRTATGFIDAPATIATTLSFAPANSNSIADTIAGLSQTVTLDTGKNYIAMAIGNVGTGFEANPDGENTNFRLLVVEDAREQANNSSEVDILVVHGSTDAPTVDVVVEANNSILVNNAKYGDATAYASVMPTTYRLLVQDSGNTTTVASFDAPLGGFTGEAAVVFASGYLTPANDNNGPAFGLFAAVGDQVVPLTNTTSVYEVSKTIEANAYPNPATNNLNIEFNLNNNSPITLEVFDNVGRLVATETTAGVTGNNTLKVNTATLNTGVYFFTLKTKEGVNTSRFAVSK